MGQRGCCPVNLGRSRGGLSLAPGMHQQSGVDGSDNQKFSIRFAVEIVV